MFDGMEMVELLGELGVSHVVWLPDSAMGPWESALDSAEHLSLMRVCREGEAWPLAAGLLLGGATPLVMMQTTGLFESGDALRNVLFDLKLPVFAVIGARSWLVEGTRDSAKRFALPLLDAWGIEYVMVEEPAHKDRIRQHWSKCQAEGIPGAALIAEGRM